MLALHCEWKMFVNTGVDRRPEFCFIGAYTSLLGYSKQVLSKHKILL